MDVEIGSHSETYCLCLIVIQTFFSICSETCPPPTQSLCEHFKSLNFLNNFVLLCLGSISKQQLKAEPQKHIFVLADFYGLPDISVVN